MPSNQKIHRKPKIVLEKEKSKKKEKRKAVKREVDYLQDYNDLLLENLSKEFYSTKSPHLVISRQWFIRIKNHSIMLKNVRETLDGNNRLVYYEIDIVGSNIKYVKKQNKKTPISYTVRSHD